MQDDPAMKDMDMPFDGKRMIWGGFQTVFESDPIRADSGSGTPRYAWPANASRPPLEPRKKGPAFRPFELIVRCRDQVGRTPWWRLVAFSALFLRGLGRFLFVSFFLPDLAHFILLGASIGTRVQAARQVCASRVTHDASGTAAEHLVSAWPAARTPATRTPRAPRPPAPARTQRRMRSPRRRTRRACRRSTTARRRRPATASCSRW